MSSREEVTRDIVVAMIQNKPPTGDWDLDPSAFTNWVIDAYGKVLEAVKSKWEKGYAGSSGGGR